MSPRQPYLLPVLRLLPALALAAALVLPSAGLMGCENFDTGYRILAGGKAGEVVVVADSATWAGPIGEALRAEIGPYQTTLSPMDEEHLFDLRRMDLTEQFYNVVQRQHAVVFAAPLTDSTAEAKYLRDRLGPDALAAVEGGAPGVFSKHDLWAEGQVIVYATGATAEATADAIRQRGPILRRQLAELVRVRTEENMFEKARQHALEDTLLLHHGFAVGVQHDYFIAKDTTYGADAGYVRLRRLLDGTWRDFFITYEPGRAPLAPDALADELDRLAQTHLPGSREGAFVQLERRKAFVADTVEIEGLQATELRGLWRMTEDFMGGPFVAYRFYEPAQDRTYTYYGMVFAPNFRKREFLRQMEVIAHTFRTDAAGSANVVMAANTLGFDGALSVEAGVAVHHHTE